MPSSRIERVAELIRQELAGLLGHDVDETREALVTITWVRLTPDMRIARIHVSIFPDSADQAGIMAALERRRGRLKGDLGRVLRLKHVPDLEFRLDDTARQTQRIEEILRGEAGGESGED